MTSNFFSPLSFVAVFGSGIRDGEKSGFGIRDKHPGSATLLLLTSKWAGGRVVDSPFLLIANPDPWF